MRGGHDDRRGRIPASRMRAEATRARRRSSRIVHACSTTTTADDAAHARSLHGACPVQDLEGIAAEQLLVSRRAPRSRVYRAAARHEKVRAGRAGAQERDRIVAQKRRAQLARAARRAPSAHVRRWPRRCGMDHTPRRIEGYDISNTQGVLSVASMVVAIDGRARAASEYRHLSASRPSSGANDFASMNGGACTRRLTRG